MLDDGGGSMAPTPHFFNLNKWVSLLCRPLGGGWNFNYDLLG
jgi:hypothetical protein